MEKSYLIKPVPAPRMTRSDRWKKRDCVMRYFAFRDEVKRLEIIVENGDTITFHVPMPKSWTNKKRAKMLHMPHQQRPDVDNLCKALLDSIFEEDSHIYDIRIRKFWTDSTGKIKIRNEHD